MRPKIIVEELSKSFVLHLQGGLELPVFRGLHLSVGAGDCVVLAGPSGAGKSTLMRCIYGNYRPTAGSIRLMHQGRMVEVAGAEPATILELRRSTMGYVSQFLRVIPRVPTLDLVMEPLLLQGLDAAAARTRAAAMLERLNIAERLWLLPPATFSGGEQQRVNIARCFAADYPILLLDEPTASLDADNRQSVIALIQEARARGAAIVGIFHDTEVRAQVATRSFEIVPYREAA